MSWWEIQDHLDIVDNHLHIGGFDTVYLAEKYGTPLYVTNLDRVKRNAREFDEAFSSRYSNTMFLYAYKANSHAAICRLLVAEGWGADVVSPEELKYALRMGVDLKKIVYTQAGKSDEELEYAASCRVKINLDCLDELIRLEKICEKNRREVEVSFRVNPEIDPKTHPKIATALEHANLGVSYKSVEGHYERATKSKYIKPTSIHMHIGSQILDSNPFREATARLFDIVGSLKDKGIEIKNIGLGGGLGIRYSEEQKSLGAKGLAEAIIPMIESKISQYNLDTPQIWFEPGRYVVGDSTVFLSKVVSIKPEHPIRKKIFVNTGFTQFIRPQMYDAYHHAVVANNVDAERKEVVDIVGNICESHDDLAKERLLPEIKHGDTIAFLGAGAYSPVMVMPDYNMRGNPRKIVIKDKKVFWGY